MRRLISILLAAVLMLVALPLMMTTAQEPSETPEYLRFCERGSEDQTLIDAFNQVTPRLNEIEQALEPFDSGNLTFLEGIGLAEGFMTTWQETQLPDCLLPLKKDVDDALNELLLAMLYGQTENTEKSTEHMGKFTALRDRISTGIQTSIDFLNTPVTEVQATPTTEAAATGLRSAEELNPMMQDFLLNNGVSVLDNASIQVFPGNTLVLIQLNRFSEEYDYANVIYTLDQLADLIGNWPETAEITSIVVETYDGSERVLVVTASGESFRNYYYNGTLTKEEFEAQLVTQ